MSALARTVEPDKQTHQNRLTNKDIPYVILPIPKHIHSGVFEYFRNLITSSADQSYTRPLSNTDKHF